MRISRDAKKATKAEAYALIVDMKTRRRELYPEDIDALLLYFAPALPKKAKTVEQRAAKAAADAKESREYLRYLHVKDGVVMASDGHRAHRGKTTLGDGYYCPRTFAPVDFDGVFPDLNRVYPDRKRLAEFDVAELDNGKTSKTLTYRRVPDGTAVNEAYLVDALNGREASRNMAGDSEFGEWVIMGMRV